MGCDLEDDALPLQRSLYALVYSEIGEYNLRPKVYDCYSLLFH